MKTVAGKSSKQNQGSVVANNASPPKTNGQGTWGLKDNRNDAKTLDSPRTDTANYGKRNVLQKKRPAKETR